MRREGKLQAAPPIVSFFFCACGQRSRNRLRGRLGTGLYVTRLVSVLKRSIVTSLDGRRLYLCVTPMSWLQGIECVLCVCVTLYCALCVVTYLPCVVSRD